MMLAFISLDFFDVLDILLVAFLFYQIYMLIKGSVAINIFFGIFIFYLFWLIVRAFNMELLSSILGQFIGVGVIALIIVFQQEIRKFLLLVGTRYNFNKRFDLERFFPSSESFVKENDASEIVEACFKMSETKTGALIVISQQTDLDTYANTGLLMNSIISCSLLESVFFKNAPLHDGAMIISEGKINAARCILPVSDNTNIPASLGLRHRAAIGLSQATDAHVIVVSEETGHISYVKNGNIKVRLNSEELKAFLLGDFSSFVIY